MEDTSLYRLWTAMSSDDWGNLYTKPFEEFTEQFSTESSRSRLYNALSSDDWGNLYTKSYDEFTTQFFDEEDKEQAQANIEYQQPKKKGYSPGETFSKNLQKLKNPAKFLGQLYGTLTASVMKTGTEGVEHTIRGAHDIPKGVVEEELKLFGVSDKAAKGIGRVLTNVGLGKIGHMINLADKVREKVVDTEVYQEAVADIEKLEKASKRYDKDITQYIKEKDYDKMAGAALFYGVETLPVTVMAMFGGPAGLSAIGLMSAGEKLDELDERDDLSGLQKT